MKVLNKWNREYSLCLSGQMLCLLLLQTKSTYKHKQSNLNLSPPLTVFVCWLNAEEEEEDISPFSLSLCFLPSSYCLKWEGQCRIRLRQLVTAPSVCVQQSIRGTDEASLIQARGDVRLWMGRCVCSCLGARLCREKEETEWEGG